MVYAQARIYIAGIVDRDRDFEHSFWIICAGALSFRAVCAAFGAVRVVGDSYDMMAGQCFAAGNAATAVTIGAALMRRAKK
jgi:hypothetical protein